MVWRHGICCLLQSACHAAYGHDGAWLGCGRCTTEALRMLQPSLVYSLITNFAVRTDIHDCPAGSGGFCGEHGRARQERRSRAQGADLASHRAS